MSHLTNKSNEEYPQQDYYQRRIYEMEHASEWVEEAERDVAPVKLHPALKQMLIGAVASHGLSRAGVFVFIDNLALFAKNNESIFLADTSETQ